ncbi:unnamed protein product [Ixodes hexagonus]
MSGMTEEVAVPEEEPDYSVFENKTGLAEDMKFLASMPELCDVTFLVGDTREPVCAVKAVLAARSRVFHKMLYGFQGVPTRERDTASKKRDLSKETKLKLFLKRSSEPILNIQFPQVRVGSLRCVCFATAQTHQTLIIEEFEPDVFRQLIEYIHTGCVTLQARTLLGLMNAADYYGLEELRKGCMGFVQCCISVDTVCALLASAERYIQYKCTKSLVQRVSVITCTNSIVSKVLEFVDNHGNEVLSLGSFALLPEHVVRLILSREELTADELTKFQAAVHWSKRYCDTMPEAELREVMGNFLECIELYKIPAGIIMREVHPLGVVPDHIIMNALAYQADPSSVDMNKISSPNRFRRSTVFRWRSVSPLRSMSIADPSPEKPPESDNQINAEVDKANVKTRGRSKSTFSRPYRRSKTLAES